MGDAKTAAEVGVKLVLDSNSKAVTDQVSGHLKAVGDQADKTKKKVDMSLGGNAKSIGGLMAAGFSASAAAAALAAGAVVGFGVKSVHAAMESAHQVKALANTFTLLDDGSTSLQDIKRFASQTKDELQELAIASGTASADVVQVFNDVMERGGKTEEQAHRLTGAMVMAGRATAGGATELSNAFEMIQLGVIRARNPIVGMIAATHTLKGNAKQVAAAMLQMPIEKQMKLAQTAIEKMADKMKSAPMTLGQMKTSMGEGIDKLFESAGNPILKHLTPVVAKVHGIFMGLMPDIEAAAEAFGGELGRGLDVVIPVIEELFAAVKANSGEIKQSIKEITEPLRDVFEYVYENRHAFASTIADVAMVLVKAGAEIVKAMMAIYGMIGSALKWIAKTGVLGKDVAQGIGQQELDAQAKDVRKSVMSGDRTGATGNASLADKQAAQQKFVASYTETYGSDKVKQGLEQFDATWQRAVDDHNSVMGVARDNENAARMADTASFVKAWQAAEKAQDVGAQTYVSQFLFHNQALQKALAEDGPKLLGQGFGTLIDNLKGQGTLGADAAKTLSHMEAPKGIASKAGVVQNFNGPINVKQDFRDQDPDRVAIVFKEEMGRVGNNRLQSRMASPFGF